MDGETVGRWILEVGHRLFEEGSLPGLPSWEQEESPELRVSLTAWWGDEVVKRLGAAREEALQVAVGPTFSELVEKAFRP